MMLERPLDVREPVQIDAEHRREQAAQIGRHVESRILEHSVGEVDDLDVVVIPLEKRRDARQAHRVHLEHRGRRQ